MLTHVHTHRVAANGAAAIGTSFTISAEGESNLDLTVPAESTDFTAVFALDVSQVKSLFIHVTGASVVIKTNSLGSPANTFTVNADHPFVWTYLDGPSFKDTANGAVSTDITALHIVNADEDNAAAIKIRSLLDPTV